MTLPGNTLTREDSRAPTGPTIPLATVFIACETERAPDGVHFLPSLQEYLRVCGERTIDTQAGYDWLEGHSRNGGAGVYLTPLRGPAAAAAEAELEDADEDVAATVAWQVPGAYGNRAAVDVEAGTAGNFIVKLLIDDDVVKTSPQLANQVALQAWAASTLGGGLVTVTPGAGTDPIPTVSPVALTGGDDDFDGVGVTQIAAAIATFTPDLGPGAIVLPGRTAAASHAEVADALLVARVNRVAHLAMPDVEAATIAEQAADIREHAAADMIDLIAGRLVVPGLTPSTSRTITLDALRTGCQGRNDAAGVTPNQPAAGTFGEATWATGLTHEGSADQWTDAEIELLYGAGVNVAKVVDGRIRLYGSRTAADPSTAPAGLRLGSARLRMAIAELLRFRVESIQFHELDPAGARVNELKAQIAADVDSYPTSVYAYTVACSVEAGETPGTAVLNAAIEDLQVSYDAEVIHASISRTLTEV